ncbi:MAG TPA: hypothetical protein VFD73_08675, partial [Gemmatimonadales bacterium]|nr:hypothetical protein [Gemmatimonadales bacterium]
MAGVDLADVAADLNQAGHGENPRLTVIVPTRDERHGIELLMERLGPAVAPLDAELIFVDDSDDGTPDVLAEQAAACPVPI